MNIESVTEMKATLHAVSDALYAEIVRLSHLRKQVHTALDKVEAAFREEVATHRDLPYRGMTPETPAPQEYGVVVEEEDLPMQETAPVKAQVPVVSVQKETKVKKAAAKKAPAPQPVGITDKAMVLPANVMPTLKWALVEVMGTDVVSVDEALKRLKAKGWEPNARDPKGVVAHRLSQTKNLFERNNESGRGFYRVRAGAPMPTLPKTRLAAADGSAKKAPKVKAVAKKAPKVKAVAKKNGATKAPKAAKKAAVKTDDDILSELGIRPGFATKPFARS